MGEFLRDRLPDPVSYFEGEDVRLVGPGQWRTGPCHFHGGSDSLRVNIKSGGWCCMACGAKGGDVLAYQIQMHGMDFVEAARALGAYVDDGKRYRSKTTVTTLLARDAMQLVALELGVILVVIADIRAGVIPNDADWQRFLAGAGRVDALVREFAT
jgi:hypothetical protein